MAQGVQPCELTPAEKEPTGHTAQNGEEAFAYCPGGHGAHAAEPGAAYVPAGQATHMETFVMPRGPYVPAGHGRQAAAE